MTDDCSASTYFLFRKTIITHTRVIVLINNTYMRNNFD